METICRITDKLIVIVYDQYNGILHVSEFRILLIYQAKVTLGGMLPKNSQLDYHFVYLFSDISIYYYAAKLKCRLS